MKESGISGYFKTTITIIYIDNSPHISHVLMWLFQRDLRGQGRSSVGRLRLSSPWPEEDAGPRLGNQNSEGKS